MYPWYALWVRSRHEKTAADILGGKGFETFLPVYRSRRRWSDRIQELDLPLIPGYVFCRFDVKHRLPVLTTPSVVQIVGSGKTPEAERFPSAALVLAGSGAKDLVSELHSQADELGIANHVFWPGFLKGEEKRAAFADADLFVLPSWSENFGIAVVEAMAAGCAVVVSDQVGIHGDIAAANAGAVVRCDVADLADALCQLLADRPARAFMGFNGKCLTQTHYSIETVTSRLLAAYNAALSL